MPSIATSRACRAEPTSFTDLNPVDDLGTGSSGLPGQLSPIYLHSRLGINCYLYSIRPASNPSQCMQPLLRRLAHSLCTRAESTRAKQTTPTTVTSILRLYLHRLKAIYGWSVGFSVTRQCAALTLTQVG